MSNAMIKVDVPLSERYLTTCARCGYERQIFGTAEEAKARALQMGWEFRSKHPGLQSDGKIQLWVSDEREKAYCPHCAILTQEPR